MNELTIHDYLKAKGLNEYGIAGLMGNLFAESGLNPRNLQNSYESVLGMNDNAYVIAVDNGTYKNFVWDKAGFGIAQWTYWSRKQALLDFASAVGKSIGDLLMQLDFLWKELSESYPSVLAVLRSATSVLEASNAVLLNYEKPANQSVGVQEKRAEYGQRYYDQFATTAQKGGGSMKYTESNKPLVCMQTQSTCYRGTRTMAVKGILWHSTGANNPWLKRYVQPSDNDPNKANLLALLGVNQNHNDWNHVEHQAGLNCWIGKLADGSVAAVQTMPWDYRPWGCGSGKKGSCNTGWIQFEICEDGLSDPDYFAKVYKEACEITAYLCKLYNIDPHGTVKVNGATVPAILCHADSCTLGLGSNHGDVLHWFPKFGKSMETARNDVAALLSGATSEEEDDMTELQVKEICKQVMAEQRKELQDNDCGSWSKEARDWATSIGLIAGGGTLPDGQPNYMWADTLTREQAAALFFRFAQMMGKA